MAFSMTASPARVQLRGASVQSRAAPRAVARASMRVVAEKQQTVLIGLAADSGCGKSTFMRRMTNLFGGTSAPPPGGNPDSNSLISDTTTVLCLDDYHCHDREGRKKAKVTALALTAQNFGAARRVLSPQFRNSRRGIAPAPRPHVHPDEGAEGGQERVEAHLQPRDRAAGRAGDH
jgi:energy-coupling factor transporter ATP-binding protein EcfA2